TSIRAVSVNFSTNTSGTSSSFRPHLAPADVRTVASQFPGGLPDEGLQAATGARCVAAQGDWMSSAGDYGNGASPASAPASNGAPHSGQAREVDQRPALFLMIESLETGGSERQFSELAWCLDRRAFQIHLSCIRPQGPFL